MNKKIYILDGGLGTDMFINGGFDRKKLNEDPLWLSRVTHENPDAIKACHKRFLTAGCDVISTATYQASVGAYMKHAGMTKEKAEATIASSVDICKAAIMESGVQRNVLISGSISPYGAILHDMSEYTGAYIDGINTEELSDFHKDNVKILASKGVDIFAFETLPALKEAKVLVDLLREYPDKKAWVSFTTKNGTHTSYGDPFNTVFNELSKCSQVIAIGANCYDAKFTPLILQAARESMSENQKCIIYPDNRLCGESNLLSWLPEIKAWLDTEMIMWLGGCCMTTPAHIKSIKECVQKWEDEH